MTTPSHGHEVVSSEDEELILVDLAGNEIGFATKADAHDGEGILHRAFSIFLRDADGRILVQQRAAGKRLWAGYWANTVCSHPRRGETMAEATQRRMSDEIGVAVPLEYRFTFDYHARFGVLGSERELCDVYVGVVDPATILINQTEIAATQWLSASELDAALRDEGDRFTPWLHLEWERLRAEMLAQ